MSETFLREAPAQRRLDITGIENAILDLLVRVGDPDLEQLGLTKGTMKLVDTDEQAHILEHIGNLEPEIEAGGSCANVLRMAARLGCRTSYSSAVGPDLNGSLFSYELDAAGVKDRLVHLEGVTGTSIVLVSADGERTMNTHLGVCRQYAPEHVPVEDVAAPHIFFTTAYMWDTQSQIEAIEKALDTARAAGARVALDLADPFAVERSRERLLAHVEKGLDLLFANAEEGRMMTGLDAAEAAIEMARTVEIAVVTDGRKGAYIASGDERVHVPARSVSVVDTTGAGDCFAAGFMTGLVRRWPLAACGELATLLAADTIGHLGVKLSAGIEARSDAVFAG